MKDSKTGNKTETDTRGGAKTGMPECHTEAGGTREGKTNGQTGEEVATESQVWDNPVRTGPVG